jgi:hypothetical protein
LKYLDGMDLRFDVSQNLLGTFCLAMLCVLKTFVVYVWDLIFKYQLDCLCEEGVQDCEPEFGDGWLLLE